MYKAAYSKQLVIGPGGRKCPCCFPPPGSRARYLEFRRAKRRLKKEAFTLQDVGEFLLFFSLKRSK